MGFFDFLTEEIAIDLGTANTLIIHKERGSTHARKNV